MDNGPHVHSQIPKEDREDSSRQIVQLQADLRDANQLIDSMNELDDLNSWMQFKRILIEPTLIIEKKYIEALNRDLKNHPEKISELVFHNAFVEVLEMVTDFPKLKKKYAQEIKLKAGRLQQLENKR